MDQVENAQSIYNDVTSFKSDDSEVYTSGSALLMKNGFISFAFIETTNLPKIRDRTERTLSEMMHDYEYDDWDEIKQPTKKSLTKLLQLRFQHGIQPNVVIKIGHVKFSCHILILQAYSKYFYELARKTLLIKLPKEKVSVESFTLIYKWMLADEPELQRQGIVELLYAAEYLSIPELIHQCWSCFGNIEIFSEENAFKLFVEAKAFNMPPLQELMLCRIRKFFLVLVASRDYLELAPREVCVLLSSNIIGVNSESEVFMAGVLWLNHDWAHREEYVIKVMKCVRFNLLTPWILASLSTEKKCAPIARVIGHNEVREMLNDAIAFVTTKLQYGEKSKRVSKLLADHNALERPWVYDKSYAEHHRFDCNNAEYINYASFLKHLLLIQRIGVAYCESLIIGRDLDVTVVCCKSAECE